MGRKRAGALVLFVPVVDDHPLGVTGADGDLVHVDVGRVQKRAAFGHGQGGDGARHVLGAASDLGYRVKLLGVAVRTEAGIEQRVHPTMVPKDSAIAQVMGVTNAVTVDAEGLAPITLVGPGAGRPPRPSFPTLPILRAGCAPRRSAVRPRA